MKKLHWALLLNALWVGTSFAACGDTLPTAGRQLLEQTGVQLSYAPQGGKLPLGRHFALDIEVCAVAGSARPALLRVDADMPAHRHGMNYRATVQAQSPGRYVSQGLMFHMPGRWRLLFDLAGAEGRGPQRLSHEITVE